jgi:hypothetical protein
MPDWQQRALAKDPEAHTSSLNYQLYWRLQMQLCLDKVRVSNDV